LSSRPADSKAPARAGALMEIKDLHTHFHTYWGTVRALNGVDFRIERGEILGLVGESGSGKSVTSLSILRLIRPPGEIVSGRVMFDGRDLLRVPEEEMNRIRGRRIAMIFQSPRTSLNPLFTVGQQMEMTYRYRWGIKGRRALDRAGEMLRRVGIAGTQRTLQSYPHELSSGMCQRVMVAMALSCEPDLLIADEPTTGLDVTLQAQILELVREQVQGEGGTSCMLITHDLGVVAETCERTVVMYAGRVVETADTKTLFRQPRHPYSIGLMKSTLRVDVDKDLYVIKGNVPNLLRLGPGCPFRDRCNEALPECAGAVPPRVDLGEGHTAHCHLLGR